MDRWTDRQTDRQKDRQTERQTDESDSIGYCPTNVEHPILLLPLQCEVHHKKTKTYYSCVTEPDNFYLYNNRKTQPVLHLDLIPVRILLENFKNRLLIQRSGVSVEAGDPRFLPTIEPQMT